MDALNGIDSLLPLISSPCRLLTVRCSETGTIYWATVTSPDTDSSGALVWGVAVDQAQVYFTALNPGQVSWQLQPSNVTINNSAYGAADLASGSLLWETAVPYGEVSDAAPTVVGDLVLVGASGKFFSDAPPGTTGYVVGLNKFTGKVVYLLATDDIMYGGIAVQDEYVLFGTGYAHFNSTGSFNVYAVSD